MAKTFNQMVSEAKSEVQGLSPQEVQQRVRQNPKLLLIDVREPDDLAATGAVPGAVNVPLGVLPIKADLELPEALRDQRLQDREQEVVVTCGAGGQGALGAKTLKDMGFTNVRYLEGGIRGWTEAGLPTEGKQ